MTKDNHNDKKNYFNILWLPGYILIFFAYLSPTEWGSGRNVSGTGRQWRYRNILAPIYSIVIYALIILFIFNEYK